MPVLTIDDAARAKARAVMEHAEKYPYIPETSDKVPGDDPSFVAVFDDHYRAVFTYTHMNDGIVYRHISISVLSDNKKAMAHPLAAAAICELFGFTGFVMPEESSVEAWVRAFGVAGWVTETCEAHSPPAVIVAQPVAEWTP